jgi:hypothetical protein
MTLGRTMVVPIKRYVSAYFHSKPRKIRLGKSQAASLKKIHSAGPLILSNIDYN